MFLLCHFDNCSQSIQDIGHLVKIKGLVTRASDVKPQITVCTYTCETCGSELFQEVLITHIRPVSCKGKLL